MSYVGWKIFAYRYYHDKPELRRPVSKEILRNNLRQRFQSPEYYFGNLRITHAKSMTEMRLEFEAEEFEIELENGTKDECCYLCSLTSEFVKRWKSQEVHKQFMYKVIYRLPWRDKAGAFIEDDHLMLAWEYGANVVPPIEITPRKWAEYPIPEQLARD